MCVCVCVCERPLPACSPLVNNSSAPHPLHNYLQVVERRAKSESQPYSHMRSCVLNFYTRIYFYLTTKIHTYFGVAQHRRVCLYPTQQFKSTCNALRTPPTVLQVLTLRSPAGGRSPRWNRQATGLLSRARCVRARRRPASREPRASSSCASRRTWTTRRRRRGSAASRPCFFFGGFCLATEAGTHPLPIPPILSSKRQHSFV